MVPWCKRRSCRLTGHQGPMGGKGGQNPAATAINVKLRQEKKILIQDITDTHIHTLKRKWMHA